MILLGGDFTYKEYKRAIKRVQEKLSENHLQMGLSHTK
jgi:hypothetical protein